MASLRWNARVWLLWLVLLCGFSKGQRLERLLRPRSTIVQVPAGMSSAVLGGNVTQQVSCNVLLGTTFTVLLRVEHVDGREEKDMVKPDQLVFDNLAMNALHTRTQVQNFSLFGAREGRFYLTYQLTGDVDQYELSAKSSVFAVTHEGEGWYGIWYELAFNMVIFLSGMAFFAWRRTHPIIQLPIWHGEHQQKLFERINYDDLSEESFADRYGAIVAGNLKDRVRKFLVTPCDREFVSNTCGVPSALNLRFLLDAGHLFAFLTIFSVSTMIPVNYLSGDLNADIPKSNFQESTFSNVPLHSNWYWFHVVYCYLVAFAVLRFIERQMRLSNDLMKSTTRIVGSRSILIHHGLPPTMTTARLRRILCELYPTGIEEVKIIYDLRKLHGILDQRKQTAAAIDRMVEIDVQYNNGTLSPALVWLPGDVLLPNPSEMAHSYLHCRPCKLLCRRSRGGISRTTMSHYDTLQPGEAIRDERIAQLVNALEQQLDFFPEEALELYENRRCAGAAFVTFDSSETRDDFVELVRQHSLFGRSVNKIQRLTQQLRYGRDACNKLQRKRSTENATQELAVYVPSLMLAQAPEPDDVIWKSIVYRPFRVQDLVTALVRQVITLGLLLLFSTPTAVLMFIKLDATSGIYMKLYEEHSVLVTMIATYLPSLLLMTVNWLLLTFLYFLAMWKPSISETERTRSFLVTGFIYLIVSSVFLPCIGVTVAYMAFSHLEKDQRTYIESFLFKVTGTFFISYVCQRTFLGALIEVMRLSEQFLSQPWIYSRSVTQKERQEALKPEPFYFGHEYAMVLSVFLVVLLGTVMTPILTPFGAVYFYVKYLVNKYNFFYVVPYAPGRGLLARTAYSITFVCLVLFEVTMAFVLVQVAGKAQFTAMLVLLGVSSAYYFLRIAGMSDLILKQLEGLRGKPPVETSPKHSTTASPPSSKAGKSWLVKSHPSTLEEEKFVTAGESYTDPYKASLCIFKLLGANQFREMTSTKSQLKLAMYRLKRNTNMDQRQEPQA